jgi:hypothetical protein
VPEPPATGAASRAADDPRLRALIRAFIANRGVWESGWWLGARLDPRPGRRRLGRLPQPERRRITPAGVQRGKDGIDTFVSRDGLIRVQTVRYTLQPAP